MAGDGFVHVSLDLDVVDPEVAPGVGTALRGGLSYREAHLALELVAEAGVMTSLDVVEVNPILDRGNRRLRWPSSWSPARSGPVFSSGFGGTGLGGTALFRQALLIKDGPPALSRRPQADSTMRSGLRL